MTRVFQILSVLLVAIAFAACSTNSPDMPRNSRVAFEMQKSPKRGTCFNFKDVNDMALLTPCISWYYNWGNTATNTAAAWFDQNDVDFCPMCWSGNYSADAIRQYVGAHPNTKYLLAFNEPNLTDQANMTPAAAAALWPPVVALAKELNLKLVAPAMNYGTLAGYGDPIKWMDEFLAQPGVSLDDISVMSLHCYMGNPGAMMNFVNLFDKYGKPIWMTEFCGWESSIGSADAQMQYMVTALNMLEQSDKVERYAWFMPRTGNAVDSYPYMQLLTHMDPSELTDLGKVYVRFTTFDKATYLNLANPVGAHLYVGISRNDIPVRISTDNPDLLMLNPISQDDWTEYHVYTDVPLSSLHLRYATIVKTRLAIDVDDKAGQEIEVPSSGSMKEWATLEVPVEMKKGKHCIRLRIISGGLNLSSIEG